MKNLFKILACKKNAIRFLILLLVGYSVKVSATEQSSIDETKDVYEGDDFSGIKLVGRNLMDLTFNNCNFTDADFEAADLFVVKFVNCNLKNVNFKKVKFADVLFINCQNIPARDDQSFENSYDKWSEIVIKEDTKIKQNT